MKRIGAWFVAIFLGLALAAAAQPNGASGAGPGPVNPCPGNDCSHANITATGSTTALSLGNLFSYQQNVKSFGAVLNGTTDDTAAFSAARTATGLNGTIFVPPGGIDNSGNPSGGPAAGDVLWLLSGNVYNTSTTPVTSIGGDVVESVYGGKYFGRSTSQAITQPTVRIDGTWGGVVSTTGAVSGTIGDSLWTVTNVPAPATSTSYLSQYVWGSLSQMTDSHIGPAQDVAGADQAQRPSTALNDGFGPRGEIWSHSSQTQDNTGVASNLSGALVGNETDVAANDDDPGSSADGGDRIILSLGAQQSQTNTRPARIGRGIQLGTSGASFFGSAFSLSATGYWDTAAIDTSLGSPLVETITTTTNQSSAGVTIPMPYTSGITVGAAVTGTDIAANSVVVSKIANTSVTLNNATTNAVPLGTAITFTLSSSAPAIRIGQGQFFSFDGSAKHEMSVQTGTGSFYYTVSNNTAFEVNESGTSFFYATAGGGITELVNIGDTLNRLQVGYNGSGITNNIISAQVISDNNGDLLLAARTNYTGSIEFFTTPSTTAVEAMSINSAGGIVLNAFSGISTSATDGFVALPYTAGTPTGTPTTGTTNCAIDTTNGYFNCYYSGTWHKIAFASGAG